MVLTLTLVLTNTRGRYPRYGSRFITAMQGGVPATGWDDDSAPLLKTAPTLKHYIAYDVDCSSGHSDGGYFGCPAPGMVRARAFCFCPVAVQSCVVLLR